MLVFDDVLADPVAYRAAVLARPFADVSWGDVFHGIQLADDETFPAWIAGAVPAADADALVFSSEPAGQLEPNYVHTDRDMGEWTAILYLNPQPAPGDGTMFWRNTATGALGSDARDTAALLDEQRAWRDHRAVGTGGDDRREVWTRGGLPGGSVSFARASGELRHSATTRGSSRWSGWGFGAERAARRGLTHGHCHRHLIGLGVVGGRQLGSASMNQPTPRRRRRSSSRAGAKRPSGYMQQGLGQLGAALCAVHQQRHGRDRHPRAVDHTGARCALRVAGSAERDAAAAEYGETRTRIAVAQPRPSDGRRRL